MFGIKKKIWPVNGMLLVSFLVWKNAIIRPTINHSTVVLIAFKYFIIFLNRITSNDIVLICHLQFVVLQVLQDDQFYNL